MPVFKNSQSGFSMVEMLVAIVVLAVGLLGLAGLQLTAIKTNAHSHGLMAASSVAQLFLEDVTSWQDSCANRSHTSSGFGKD